MGNVSREMETQRNNLMEMIGKKITNRNKECCPWTELLGERSATSEAEYTHILFLSLPHSFSLSSKMKIQRGKENIQETWNNYKIIHT